MSTLSKEAILVLAAASWALLLPAPAGACDTPVFRYALERWEPDAYPVVVFHAEPLSPTQRQAFDCLRNASIQGGGSANMAVRLVDVSGDAEWPQAAWGFHGSPQLPHVVVVYPPGTASGRRVWAGPLSMSTAEVIADSPARRRIAERISAGQSGVWILVQSGDRPKDDAAASLLTEQLSRMPRLLTLPTRPADPRTTAAGQPPRQALTIEFSLIRLSRSDPAERVLLAALLGSEPDLNDRYASQPVAFPIFGRGRALYALIGKGINQPNILEACAQLVGMCSCEIKAENPGTDLLLAANWEAAIADLPSTAVVLPAVIAAPGSSGGVRRGVPGSTGNKAAGGAVLDAAAPAGGPGPEAGTGVHATSVASGNALLRNTLAAVAVIGLVVVCIVLFVLKRAPPS